MARSSGTGKSRPAAVAIAAGPAAEASSDNHCRFRACGCIKGKTPSPIDPTSTIEWEYPDGRGSADLFCANTFRYRYRHLYDRDELIERIKDSKDAMDKFMQDRKQVIERAKRKVANGTFRVRDNARPTKKLERKRHYEQALLPPAPDVLPWAEYQATVSPTVQKKLGHKKQLCNGQLVVIMLRPQWLQC